MAALLDDPAALDDHDQIRVTDRGEPVGNDEARTIPPQFRHRLLHQQFGSGVDRAGRLIKDQQLGLGHKGPSDGDQLLLAGAEVAAVVAECGLITVRQRSNEVVDVGGACCSEDVTLGRVGSAVGDVLGDGPAEQPAILKHHPDPGSQ